MKLTVEQTKILQDLTLLKIQDTSHIVTISTVTDTESEEYLLLRKLKKLYNILSEELEKS